MITKYYYYNDLKNGHNCAKRNFFYSNPRSKDSAREFLSTSYGKFTMIFFGTFDFTRFFLEHYTSLYFTFILFQCNFNIDILDKEVDMDAINAEVIGPSGPVYLNFDLGPNGGRGSFQVSFSF